MKSNVVKQAFTSTMKSAGFSKNGDAWFSDTNEAILVVNLQKSNFGDQYYVNLAIWLKALGNVRFPKEQHCHIRIRASALDPERQKYWEREVLNLEQRDIADEERFDLVRSFLEETALPFLATAGSLSELRRLALEGRLKSAAVLKSAQSLLRNDG